MTHLNYFFVSAPTLLENSTLTAHNFLRGIHLSPSLEISAVLSKGAQSYADEIVEKHNGVLVDSSIDVRLGEGENLAIHCDPRGEEMTGAEAAYKWYVKGKC